MVELEQELDKGSRDRGQEIDLINVALLEAGALLARLVRLMEGVDTVAGAQALLQPTGGGPQPTGPSSATFDQARAMAHALEDALDADTFAQADHNIESWARQRRGEAEYPEDLDAVDGV